MTVTLLIFDYYTFDIPTTDGPDIPPAYPSNIPPGFKCRKPALYKVFWGLRIPVEYVAFPMLPVMLRDSKSSEVTLRAGSSPAFGTIKIKASR